MEIKVSDIKVGKTLSAQRQVRLKGGETIFALKEEHHLGIVKNFYFIDITTKQIYPIYPLAKPTRKNQTYIYDLATYFPSSLEEKEQVISLTEETELWYKRINENNKIVSFDQEKMKIKVKKKEYF
jgi:hypothetical protein